MQERNLCSQGNAEITLCGCRKSAKMIINDFQALFSKNSYKMFKNFKESTLELNSLSHKVLVILVQGFFLR